MNRIATNLSTSLDDIIKQNRKPQFTQPKRINKNFGFMKQRKPFNDRIVRVQQKQIQKPFQRSFRRSQQQDYSSQSEENVQQPQQSLGKKIYTKKYLESQMPMEDENISMQIAQLEEQELQTRKQQRTRIIIENIHKKSNNDDLREIFEDAGELVKFGIVWDVLGRSQGWAIAEYSNEDGAMNAVLEFDKVLIDGQQISVRFEES